MSQPLRELETTLSVLPGGETAGLLPLVRGLLRRRTPPTDEIRALVASALPFVAAERPALALPSGAVNRRALVAVYRLAELVHYQPDGAGQALLLGRAALGAGECEIALELFASAAALGAGSAVLLERARTLVRLRRNSEALAVLQEASLNEPESPDLLAITMLAHAQMGGEVERLAVCERWVSIDQGHKSLENRAGALASLRRLDEALLDLVELRQREPEEPCIALNYARLLQMMGRHEEAAQAAREGLGLAKRYLKQSPNDALCLTISGRLSLSLGHWRDALQDFDRAVAATPNDPTVLIARGLAHLRLNAGERALEDFQRCKADPAKDEELHLGTAQALTQARRYVEALELLGADAPDSDQGQCIRGEALAGLSRHEEALRCFERELRRDPQDFNALYRSVVSLYALGRKREAVAALSSAIELSQAPHWAKAYARDDPDLEPLRRDGEVSRRVGEILDEPFSLRRFLAERGFDPSARR
jgi:tetratricopeptide (TPR) repeat protein